MLSPVQPSSLAVCITNPDEVVLFSLSDDDVWKVPQKDPESQGLYRMVTEPETTPHQCTLGYTVLEDKVYRKTEHPQHGTYYQIFVPRTMRDNVLN